MATYTISQLTTPNGDVLELKDKVARQAIQGGTHFLGVTTTEIEDGSSTTTVTIGEASVTAANGDIVAYGNKEFIYASADSKWHELGDISTLGALALKDSASGSYTPAGTVSQPDVDVTPTTESIDVFATAGSVSAGVAASATMPTLTFTPDASTENLTITWTDGSFTANTPTTVTLPTSSSISVMTGASAALHEAPTFSGTSATITVA